MEWLRCSSLLVRKNAMDGELRRKIFYEHNGTRAKMASFATGWLNKKEQSVQTGSSSKRPEL